MSDTPTAFCPDCGPGTVPDPLTEYLEVCAHHYRRPELQGSADGLVTVMWDQGTAVETAEQTRAACDVIHRGAAPP